MGSGPRLLSSLSFWSTAAAGNKKDSFAVTTAATQPVVLLVSLLEETDV